MHLVGNVYVSEECVPTLTRRQQRTVLGGKDSPHEKAPRESLKDRAFWKAARRDEVCRVRTDARLELWRSNSRLAQ